MSKCVDCIYSVRVAPEAQKAECRRFPPVLEFDRHVTVWRFPLVDYEDWCGEYKPRAT